MSPTVMLLNRFTECTEAGPGGQCVAGTPDTGSTLLLLTMSLWKSHFLYLWIWFSYSQNENTDTYHVVF